jgi:hypothetical protein
MNLHEIGHLPPRGEAAARDLNAFFTEYSLRNNFIRAGQGQPATITSAELRFAFESLETPVWRDTVVENGRTVRYMIADIARIRDRLMRAGFRNEEIEFLAIKVTREQYRLLQEYVALEGDFRGPTYQRETGTMTVMGITVIPTR